jgi:hypothetical protein
VQFNDGGVFAGDAGMTYNKTTNVLTVAGRVDADITGDVASSVRSLSSVAQAILNEFTLSIITNNGVPSNTNLVSVGTGVISYLELTILAVRFGGSSGSAGDSAGYVLRAVYKNVAGTLSIVGSVDKTVIAEDQPAWDADITISGTNLRLTVTGAANNDVNWKVHYKNLG